MNQNRTNLLIGILLGIFLMGIVFYFRTTISEQAPPFLIGFLTCLALMSSILIIGGIWFRKQIQDSLVGKTEDTQRPSDAFKSSMTSLAQQYLPNSSPQEIQSSIRFLQTFIWGRTVYTLLGVLVSIFIALGGILGSILIFKQNSLLETQTDKMEQQTSLLNVQNERLNLQNHLIEAERRSSLVFLMSNILDKVDEEIKEQHQEGRSDNFRFSQPLVSRIVALSKAFRPYRMMESDTLSKLVSPERGQLFIALMENDLDSLTQNTIVASGDFSYASIGKIDLENANLIGAKLDRTDLRNANLKNANLRDAQLYRANLSRTSLLNASLSHANISGAELVSVDCRNTDLFMAICEKTIFFGTNLKDASISKHQLLDVRTLHLSTLPNKKMKIEVQAEKSCLFEKINWSEKIFPCDKDNN